MPRYSCQQTLRGHNAPVLYLTYSPDGRVVVSCGVSVYFLTVTPHQYLCNTGVDATIFWDEPSGTEIARLEHASPATSAVWAERIKSLVFTSQDGSIIPWPVTESYTPAISAPNAGTAGLFPHDKGFPISCIAYDTPSGLLATAVGGRLKVHKLTAIGVYCALPLP